MSTVAPRPAAGPSESDHAKPERGQRMGLLLAVCCAAQFMVILDLSIVNVALPSIQSSLGFTPPELQWVVDAYAISFAGFLMLGGRAADHFGQRRMFVLALLVFGLASLAGGLASDRTTLVFARAAQGVGGALMAACSLAIITSSFRPGAQLNRAIGTWAAMNGLGGAAGMLFGGIITEELSWRWVLLINPPIAVAAALLAYAVVSERRRERPGSFDIAGALTLTIGQLVLVYGIVEAGLSGLGTAVALGPIFGGIALLVVFGLIETRFASEPLIPFKQLTRPLRVANNIVLLFSASLFPMWFVSSLYLQQVLGLSPLSTGLIFLPMTLTIMLVAGRAGKLVGRFGVQPVLGGGLVMLSAGMFLLARIGSSGSGVVYVMIPGLLTAAGIAMSIVPSTIAATQGAKPGQAGLASGLVNTSRQIGGGLGLAILVTLATQRSTHLIGKGVQVPQALTEGFRLAYLICGGLAAAAALLTFFAMRSPSTEPAQGELAPLAAATAVRVRRFGVAVVVLVVGFIAIDIAFANSHSAPVGAYTTKGAYSFVSAPNLHPPVVKHTTGRPTSGTPAPGYILTANFYNLSYPPIIGQSGPLILDNQLQPVWFAPAPEKLVAANLSKQSYEGKPVLSWWQGLVTNTGQTESGEDVVVDQHYRPIARLKGADGWVLTLHEFLISGEDAWVTANKNLALDLSKYGGAYNGALIDSAVQEYNLKSGKLLRSWDALHHISLGDSYATLPTNGFPWDAYHVNSIQLVGGGSLLVSMRNTWAAYLVDAASGKIRWTLGGKRSDYRFGPGAAFQWQHDVRLQPGSLVSMYDDHCCQITSGGKNVPATGPSRALVLRVDQQGRTATLANQYMRERAFAADYMGDAQPLSNGGVFVGWGSEPYFSEYTRSGTLALDAELPWPDISYRATLAHWVGLPLSKPAGAARRAAANTVVYASWNGATQLSRWRLLAGSGAGRLTAVTSAAKSGFETAIVVPGGARASAYTRFQLQALDSAGRLIGLSQPFSVSAG
ncbi:MAG TPA: MFS transporter [Solirubrobacteraceae bacterium]|jgi:EmrB/QacA subfamily drug resistance transporter|nr:MFS transporter [Solirubrobacteraceae bacterium]